MIVYSGSSKHDFKIEKSKRSRYGFPALFFASEIFLARLYAIHLAKEEYNTNGGFVYEFEISDNMHSIDYNGKSSYTIDFRNLMFKLYKENHKAVIIKNVIDYPSKKLSKINFSDIIVVFDFEVIKSFKLIESNVKSF